MESFLNCLSSNIEGANGTFRLLEDVTFWGLPLARDFFKMDRKALAKIYNFFPWTDMAK